MRIQPQHSSTSTKGGRWAEPGVLSIMPDVRMKVTHGTGETRINQKWAAVNTDGHETGVETFFGHGPCSPIIAISVGNNRSGQMQIRNCVIIINDDSVIHLDPGELQDFSGNVVYSRDKLPAAFQEYAEFFVDL